MSKLQREEFLADTPHLLECFFPEDLWTYIPTNVTTIKYQVKRIKNYTHKTESAVKLYLESVLEAKPKCKSWKVADEVL